MLATGIAVSSAASSAALTSAVAAGLGAFAVVALIVLLVMKELGSAELESGTRRPRLDFFVKALNVGILPLLLVFAVIVAVKVADVL